MPARRQSAVSPIDPTTGLPVEGLTPTSAGRSRGKEGKEKETFACSFVGCGQTYSRMEYLKRHQRKHQDDRPFQCKDCTKAFARSDVLLRHRRRCHPTPPPTDRNTQSPPAPHRNYPGVPISSSRTDAREASPTHRGGRKHPRQSSGDDDREANRPRVDPSLDPSLEDDFEGEDDERHPDGSRFSRQNGMGNGGVYSAGNPFYGSSSAPEGSAYTPHLLPMFQQNQPFHSLNDPNHLEDASVLLSMAYPGGVPSGENPDLQRDLPDWANNPTINMMMEAAVAANREQEAVNTLDSTTSTNGHSGDQNGHTITTDTPQPNGNSTLASASVDPSGGDFLSAMSWLSAMGTQGVLSQNQNQTMMQNQQQTQSQTQLPSHQHNSNSPKKDSISTQNLTLPSTQPSNNDLGSALGWMQMFASSMSGTAGSGHTGNSPKPSSPFPLSTLFSPSAFGMIPPTPDETYPENSEQPVPMSPTLKGILDQMAMYEVPQTLSNPNPERPLLRMDNDLMYKTAGQEWFDKTSPFYLPAERFAGVYQIPHWALPPLRTLSVMACRTYHTVLNHFSFVHMPTFKLNDTAACLAFAICTVGGIRTSATEADNVVLQALGMSGLPRPARALDGPVVPDQSWEQIYETNWNRSADDKKYDSKKVNDWKNGPLVRNEKTNMLVKSFSLAQGVLMTEYNVALLQALILYHAPNFLSESEHERVTANMFMGTIINITRQIGFFTPEADHFVLKINTPVEPFTPNDLDRCWKQWIQLETRRRTAYLVYQLDLVSALESNIPCILSSCEISFMPLPAPDPVWKAPTAVDWLKAAKKYRPISLDEAMRRIFFLPTFGAFDNLHESADTKFYNLLNTQDFGPFARMSMVLTLLKGVIDIGEGKRDRGDWRDLTDLWVGCSWLRPSKRMLAQDGTDLGRITKDGLRGRFGMGLQKWREGWDFDKLCISPSSIVTTGISPESGSSGSTTREPELAKETLNYCEDALPFYWLAVALLNQLNSSPNSAPGHNHFSGVRYGDMLKAARTFTRTGEGIPGAAPCDASPSYARQGSTASAISNTVPQVRSTPSSGSAHTSISPPDANASNNISDENSNTNHFDMSAMSPGTLDGLFEALGGGGFGNFPESYISGHVPIATSNPHPSTTTTKHPGGGGGLHSDLTREIGFIL
ncbi:uncharacterized protein IL334_000358 [Kwoniella shivajii]|uniref:C2H2-type domain-containing protein n=1 Tax=Kwoniella shivajii TaxID=564305 RepID=A0ABZ1CP38_9TREE|nr:hypothetical protein IL334_000358 [Kwoniella shivajii]